MKNKFGITAKHLSCSGILSFIALATLALSCGGKGEEETPAPPVALSIMAVSHQGPVPFADIAAYEARFEHGTPDGPVTFVFEGEETQVAAPPYRFETNTFNLGPGTYPLRARAAVSGQGLVEDRAELVVAMPASPRIMGYAVERKFPHDPGAFTQGLHFKGGILFESTGLYGSSSIRRVALESGELLSVQFLGNSFFGEGLTVFGNEAIQLTWRENTGFVYDAASLLQRRTFSYPTEGWGLDHDGQRLIMSDGTDKLYFLNPQTFQQTGSISVTDGQNPVNFLNELEFIDGKIFVNVFETDRIAVVWPENGRIMAYIDLEGLKNELDYQSGIDVLNGIAHDPADGRIFVTGKRWPNLFQIRVTGPKP